MFLDRTHQRDWLRAGGGLKLRPGWQLGERLTPDDLAALIQEYRDGATTRELSERFGVGMASVRTMIRREGVEVTYRRRGGGEGQQTRRD
jgi:hypothetical protein